MRVFDFVYSFCDRTINTDIIPCCGNGRTVSLFDVAVGEWSPSKNLIHCCKVSVRQGRSALIETHTHTYTLYSLSFSFTYVLYDI